MYLQYVHIFTKCEFELDKNLQKKKWAYMSAFSKSVSRASDF